MNYDTRYHTVALHVLDELNCYTGYSYTVNFTTPMDTEHLAIAIQRAVEHMQSGSCQHDVPCKPAQPYMHPNH